MRPQEGNSPLMTLINLSSNLDLDPSTWVYMQPRPFSGMKPILYPEFSYIRLESSLNINVQSEASFDSNFSQESHLSLRKVS